MSLNYTEWKKQLLDREQRMKFSTGISQIDFTPKCITSLVGPTGTGKSAFTIRGVSESLRSNSDLIACYMSIEAGEEDFQEKILSRLSGIPCDHIRNRTWSDEYKKEMQDALDTLDSFVDRLIFVPQPWTMKHLAEMMQDKGAMLGVVDYIQDVEPSDGFNYSTKTNLVDDNMRWARRIAYGGPAVVVLSAVTQTWDGNIRYRDSESIKNNSDDAFLMSRKGNIVTFKHDKHRYQRLPNINLYFDDEIQDFRELTDAEVNL